MLDELLKKIQEQVDTGKHIPKDTWIDHAFRLNSGYLTLIEALEKKRQQVAIAKLEALKSQDKKNVAAAELEVEATVPYYEMRILEAKVEQVKEYIRISKLNSNNL